MLVREGVCDNYRLWNVKLPLFKQSHPECVKGIFSHLKGLGRVLLHDTKHNANRFTFNLHGLKIMMVLKASLKILLVEVL